MVKKAPCTLACAATLAASKPEAFWLKTKIRMFNIEFPESLNKPLDLLYSNVRVACGKKAEGIDFDA